MFARVLKYLVPALGVLVCIAIDSPVWAQKKAGGRGGAGRGAAASGGAAIQRATPPAQQSQGMVGSDRSGAIQRSLGDGRIRSGDGTVRTERQGRMNGNLSDNTLRRSDRDGDHEHHGDRDRDRSRFFFGFGYPFYGSYGYSPWGYGGYYNPWWYGGYGGYPVYDYGYDNGYDIGTYGGSSASYYTTEQPQYSETRQAQSSEGMTYLRRAEQAFRAGRYDEAVRWANHAAVELPQNGRLFLLLGQALFAIGQYGPAAGAIHQGMTVADPDEWGYVVKNFRTYYGNGNDYTTQLRALEKFAAEHPDAAYGHFLLGYHYGFLGYPKEAQQQLGQAVGLEQRDQLAGKLLEQFGGEAPRVVKDRKDGQEPRGEESRSRSSRTETQDQRDAAPDRKPERTEEVPPPQ
jgi:hypothetical protein